MVKNCLIGYTGLVGSNLLKQGEFNFLFNSKNISELSGDFDLVVCCAAPAKKWYANQNPKEDENIINGLIKNLSKITTKKFILISTIDVYKSTNGCDESCDLYEDNFAYGKNRRKLEVFVENNFENFLIVRLPALFGEGLKKNILYDLIYKNNLSEINLYDEFQWYCLEDLWKDIQNYETYKQINLFTEPILNETIIDLFFSDIKKDIKKDKTKSYNNKTILFESGYLYDKENILNKLNNYICSTK
jgi:hypothetical protein